MTIRLRSLLVALALAASCVSWKVNDPLAGSRQAIVVKVDGYHLTRGVLQRYERTADQAQWRAVGNEITVVVGRNGLAEPGMKREGDGKSPSGILPLGEAFGFAERGDLTRLPYIALQPDTECVDDAASRFYNSVVDRSDVALPDWKSSEKMRSIDQYRWGVIVRHNVPPIAGYGSCIFLHIWNGPSSTTAGCTAMSIDDLETLLRWLDPSANPRLVQFTRDEYARHAGLP